MIYVQYSPLQVHLAATARQQGVIKTNESGFAELLEKELSKVYQVEKPSKKSQRVNHLLFSGNSTRDTDEEETTCFFI